jgi:hypothetical protein
MIIHPVIELLERFKWWDKPAAEIQKLIPILNDGDLERVKSELALLLSGA